MEKLNNFASLWTKILEKQKALGPTFSSVGDAIFSLIIYVIICVFIFDLGWLGSSEYGTEKLAALLLLFCGLELWLKTRFERNNPAKGQSISIGIKFMIVPLAVLGENMDENGTIEPLWWLVSVLVAAFMIAWARNIYLDKIGIGKNKRNSKN